MTAKHRILLLNGPNLNLLGKREPGIYGSTTLNGIVEHLQQVAGEHDVALQHLQSNAEVELIASISPDSACGLWGIRHILPCQAQS